MPKADDPFYTRKAVPDEVIAAESGVPGLTPEEIEIRRDRKLSTAGPGGTDLRKFSNKYSPKDDPYYHRKPVPDALIPGTGVPGLSEDQAFIARERKLSMAGPGGTDIRKFSDSIKPQNDPFYSRKAVDKKIVAADGVAEPPVIDAYESRQRKLSMFQLGADPFAELTGRRTSVAPDSALGAGRRRSSAVAPHHTAAAAAAAHPQGDRLEPIISHAEPPPTGTNGAAHGEGTSGSTTVATDEIGPHDRV